MQQVQVQLESIVSVSYDRESDAFKQSLKSFNEMIDPEGTEEDMIQHVVYNVARHGIYSMIDGVGYVGGNVFSREPYCGIDVEEPEFETSMY